MAVCRAYVEILLQLLGPRGRVPEQVVHEFLTVDLRQFIPKPMRHPCRLLSDAGHNRNRRRGSFCIASKRIEVAKAIVADEALEWRNVADNLSHIPRWHENDFTCLFVRQGGFWRHAKTIAASFQQPEVVDKRQPMSKNLGQNLIGA